MILSWATRVGGDAGGSVEERPVESLLINGADIAQIYATDVLFLSHPVAGAVQLTAGTVLVITLCACFDKIVQVFKPTWKSAVRTPLLTNGS